MTGNGIHNFGGEIMPVIKSAIKRVKTSEKANSRNSSQLSKSNSDNAIKKSKFVKEFRLTLKLT